MALSNDELTYLKLYGPSTYGLEIPKSIAKSLEDKGLVRWLPPMFGTIMYEITEAGRKEVANGTSNL